MNNEYYTTIGMDVSDRTTKVCVMAKERGARRILEETTIPTTKDALRAYLSGKSADWPVVFETGAHCRWMKREVESLGMKAIVANPARLRMVTESNTKNDRNDARELARFALADVELLHPVRLRGERCHYDFYKLYMADSGLLLSMTDDDAREDVLVWRNLGTWKGGFFENVVGEALLKAGVELAYYKRDKSTLEMDFFLRSGDCLVPVEVKSENGQSKSLKTLIESDHYPDIRWGVKLVHGNVGFENRVRTIPHWCAFLLPRLVKAWSESNFELFPR